MLAPFIRDSFFSTPVKAMSAGEGECPQGGKRQLKCESPSISRKNSQTEDMVGKGVSAVDAPSTPELVMKTMPDHQNDKITDDTLDQDTAKKKRQICMEILDSSVKVTV